jgi:negative regulator of sigma E activity
MSEKLREELSALMDGELDPARIGPLLDELEQHPELMQEWASWQAQGDRMRDEPVISAGFMARFSERLAQEPVVIAPRRSVWRRRLVPLALAASVSFVCVSAWQGGWNKPDPRIAAGREEQLLRTYLAAHLEGSGDPLAEQAVVSVSFEAGESR